MCLFIETIRVEDGQVYNMPYHVERLNRTRAAFWKDISPIDLTGIISSQSLSGKGGKFRLPVKTPLLGPDVRISFFKDDAGSSAQLEWSEADVSSHDRSGSAQSADNRHADDP